MVAVAAELRHAALHIRVEALRVGEAAAGGEHHLGRLRGELAPGLGGAGLHDDWPALHRPRDVQGAAHREIFPLVVEHMHPLGVEIDAALDVADEGVVGELNPTGR